MGPKNGCTVKPLAFTGCTAQVKPNQDVGFLQRIPGTVLRKKSKIKKIGEDPLGAALRPADLALPGLGVYGKVAKEENVLSRSLYISHFSYQIVTRQTKPACGTEGRVLPVLPTEGHWRLWPWGVGAISPFCGAVDYGSVSRHIKMR